MLTDIYNSSLREGKDWMTGKMPVSVNLQKGCKDEGGELQPHIPYRTCTCCKVMEHVFTPNIMAYLDKYQLLHSNQHGFRKNLSCEIQLNQFVQDISDTLNESGQTDITRDFSNFWSSPQTLS